MRVCMCAYPCTQARFHFMNGNPRPQVATPGRLLDVVTSGGVSFESLRVMVMDEADKLFNSAFARELDAVLSYLPGRFSVHRLAAGEDEADRGPAEDGRQIQICLFSATFPYATRARAQCLFRDRSPTRISLVSFHEQQHGFLARAPT